MAEASVRTEYMWRVYLHLGSMYADIVLNSTSFESTSVYSNQFGGLAHLLAGIPCEKIIMVQKIVPKKPLIYSLAVLSLLILVSGCATGGPPRPYFDEDSSGQYYELKNAGNILRVNQDGTVYDITCRGIKNDRGETLISSNYWLYPHCSHGWLAELGQVKKIDNEWDMSSYNIAPETGRCKPLFSTRGGGRYSCWNRLWEIPAILVSAGILLLAIGLG